MASKGPPNLEGVDPRLRAYMDPILARGNPFIHLVDLPLEDLRKTMRTIFDSLQLKALGDFPADGLRSYTIDIAVPDRDTPLTLYVNRPDNNAQVPCLVYFHGGGMALFSSKLYAPLLRRIASQGLCVIAPEFRSSIDAPFPAGLNDCYATTNWVFSHRQELGVTSQVILGGESGGGNLAIATAFRGRDVGLPISGLYIMCPHLSTPGCDYGELDGILSSHVRTQTFDRLYTPFDIDKKLQHIAYPGFATVDQLKGLPPFFIVLNEFDPTKNEGIEFYRKLLAAGVSARMIISGGTVHAAEVFGNFVPDIVQFNAECIASFAKSRL